MKRPTVTIKEIAKLLNVSKSTVSRALRDSSEISTETKKRVLELAEQLHYAPNPIALSLLKNKTQTIGVIVPDIANRFYSSVIGGVEDISYSRGYHTMIYQSHELLERELAVTRHLALRRVDGLVVAISSQSEHVDHFNDLQEQGIPVVYFDRVNELMASHKVQVDDYKGSFEATEHLIAQGCKRIAHIAGPKQVSISRNRLEGYLDALRKYKLEIRDEWMLHTEITQAGGTERTYQLMAMRDRPDAIFGASERITMGIHLALRQLGYRMPDDVAVVGFCDLAMSMLMDPPVTSVTQPSFAMGQQATTLLLDLIESNNTPVVFETRVLPSNLLIQGSSLRKS
ncbi:LacI family transcriptional regulator/LacI family repressor for deo operon, udp, cdd, tsx, nupC, and nupG [Dyadobacter jejuensis]|uniref:LacI family transcriptional regulator/LacI family repressor for deo operon, udp, cdd, tsx, nupC, and nupG n=1 Tax=Dyadobacter jejuensis TaxID=1082580 RepID=A0A316ARK8_9BACT|nr:LacI family DNA-binding transcriptional regulator [Dyadobacter jejuensis]PWJ60006.1 LacI family transcriptional regulator/LacI family repressor for deo operon, udp, cdd, tsx, nupC, and nupG [Dyadobacter jejuensis]